MSYCPNCGAELPEGAKFCSGCGVPVQNTQESATIQAESKADQEIVIKEGLCNRVKSKLFVENGYGLITNKRFIYNKHSFGKILVMGVFVNATKGSFDFEIKLNDISNLKDGKQGVSKTIIICTSAGEEYNFYFTDRQKWIIEFTNLLGADKVHCSM